MRKALLTLGIIAAGTGVGAALAQTVDGLDLGAIQRRADAQAADAATLSDEVARRAKDYAASDRIRDELLKKGIVLRDTQDGTVWEYTA